VLTDVLRPVSTRVQGGGTSVPSGTLAAVTSDNSDSTYINFLVSATGNVWSLVVGSHTPADNYQRHRIRGRVRIRTDAGTAAEQIDLGRAATQAIESATVPATASFAEQVTPWFQDTGFGLASAGALADLSIGGGTPTSAVTAASLRTAECYVDIDCRLKPQYSPQVQDAAGANKNESTVTDTNQPTLFIGAVDYDGLPPLNWFVNIRTGGVNGPTIYTAFGSGQPPTSHDVTVGLDDGEYWAVWGVRSTIRGADSFENAIAYRFEIENTVPPPSPPLVSVTRESGGYRVSWVDPGGQEWDNDYVVAEVFRDDCNGSARIAVIPDGLNGSYLDLAIPQLDSQTVPGDPDCEVSTPPCDITYRVRYWGYVSTSVELPDTIPADLILAWPSTAGTIPSGWSRVSALDGVYPRGATTTGAPSATGGAVNHSHTTPGHVHFIGDHNHATDGPTGASNTSTASNNFNGADHPQASQPHNHNRVAFTGTRVGGSSGISAPGTSVHDNLPATREVIWIQSTGTQPSYPVGCLAWTTENVSGWSFDTLSGGRFLKGAATGANGGATLGNQDHAHSINSHTHTGFTHDHTMGDVSQSNPVSSNEVETGSGTRYLPRHTHPMDVSSVSTGSLSAESPSTFIATMEPPHRRLRVLRNTGGGIQTRVIGLYTGAIADLDPVLTLCNGGSGTPDMRTLFARDIGSDSVNTTGGATTHNHGSNPHPHTMSGHSHPTNVLASETTSYPGGGGGVSPTVSHDHASADTEATAPPVTPATAQVTNTVSMIPPYKEVHFVRLDGTIAGGELPVPELKITDFSTATVPSFTYTDGLERLASLRGQVVIASDRTYAYPRLVTDSTPLAGGLHTISTSSPGEDLTLTIAVVGIEAINALEDILREDRVYYSPLGGEAAWYAPGSWTVTRGGPDVKIVQVPMVRQPWPTTPEPGEFL
jgi:hypothetical protein